MIVSHHRIITEKTFHQHFLYASREIGDLKKGAIQQIAKQNLWPDQRKNGCFKKRILIICETY